MVKHHVQIRGCDCVYTASKRGGARRRKKHASSEGRIEQSPPNELLTGPAPVVSLATPGAGLLQRDEQLDFDMDFDFDPNFLGNSEPLTIDNGSLPQPMFQDTSEQEVENPVVRTYANDEDILGAYYVYIHPYFPVLPPPFLHQAIDKLETGLRGPNDILFHSKSNPQFQTASPMTLAISTLLSLIPHPDDPNPASPESILLRRNQAQVFAQMAIDSVELENEMIESILDPGDALSSQHTHIYRTQIHPQVRLEAESTIALLLLCTYEYSERGNISKMRKRCGQALISAMDLGLHSKNTEVYDYAESDRRIWWMTAPSILLSDPRFTTPLPAFASDPDVWSVFLEAQRVIATATQFVIDLEASLKMESHNLTLWAQMAELEKTIEPLVQHAEKWSCSNVDGMDVSERVVAKSLRMMTRIKLNSSRFSSKVCMQSAFNIAQSFHALPFPQPFDPRNSSYRAETKQLNSPPRMMPIFACCAMQSSYAMIMLCHKTLAIKQASPFGDGLRKRTDKLLLQLHDGIKMILDALENYSMANEALTGMRDQIRMAVESVAATQEQSSTLLPLGI
ncbi:hypothetical protein SS1G_01386 [Sclerotinia sclerotiorum 1980 UF-70]|uniref:Transcription factor domain-containing protein n=1 Tax=Sclerotinia sclerotiorum (strain ATCC 18683 / 1980 / Ss-1) TaxID=665079 RepID=A7E7V8_SCLS1|nr:hypothetical protein SS1G_01386 [Sclerotinia sclerotiorum 1980 UF-70]EDN96460.1 hypothetical protein SS1G_01386 [Sclerotinia sclerotiorum 1980 UF-70]